MYPCHRPTLAFIALLLGTLVAAHAQTNVHFFTGGENDPGAANGAVVNNPTLDSAGSSNLTRTGDVTYTTNTPGANSTLAYQFTTGSGYLLGATNTTLTNESSFAMELWFQTPFANTQQALFHNGHIGLYVYNGVSVHRAGIALNKIGVGPLSASTWYHVAFVWDAGTLTGYLQGTPTFIGSGLDFSNPTAGNALVIGSTSLGGDPFMGTIDHARIFEFAPGTFNTSMLSYPASAIAVVPEPSTYAAILGLIALGFVIVRRSRRGAA
jgi:hypothetical protein